MRSVSGARAGSAGAGVGRGGAAGTLVGGTRVGSGRAFGWATAVGREETRCASRCAVWVMRLFDIPVLRQGNVIELMPKGARAPKRLEVVEACSGIRSLMTLLTLAVVFAYFTRPRGDDGRGYGDGGGGGGPFSRIKSYGFWRSIILVASAVPIAILTNALRVSGTGVLAHYYGTEVADGFFHSFSGWVVYIVAFLLLFAVGWLLDRVGHRGRGDKGGGTAQATAQEARAVKVETASAPAGVIQAKGVE